MRPCPPIQTLLLAPAAAALLLFSASVARATSYNWTSGAFVPGTTAPSPLPAADTLVLSTSGTKQFLVSFTNEGTVQHQLGGGPLLLGSNASVVNKGLWEDQGANSIGVSTGGSFSNEGLFRKLAAGTSSLTPTSLSNTGTIDIQQGTLTFGGFASNAGVLMGSGAINASAGILNSGTLAPGSFGAGTLALNGNYTQTAAGAFAVDLTNLGAKDLFSITGAANLAGTLALNCLGACSFSAGDSFAILSSTAARTGTFSSGVTLNGFATGAFTVVYGSNSVSLLVTQNVTPVPEPATVAMWLSGLALLGFARSASRA